MGAFRRRDRSHLDVPEGNGSAEASPGGEKVKTHNIASKPLQIASDPLSMAKRTQSCEENIQHFWVISREIWVRSYKNIDLEVSGYRLEIARSWNIVWVARPSPYPAFADRNVLESASSDKLPNFTGTVCKKKGAS